ncbi:hypothetical protein MKEN_00655600 [Mycena kentingensis (nom. inval.)]|nr:hypothetical protein MKEN_00655600 [Mycena kentingensis (nom. inval.)]
MPEQPDASPSPPRTTDNEHDLSAAHRWSDDEQEHLDPQRKGKAREHYPQHPDDPSPQQYPPTSEEEAETRRIEENLRRWELAERAKRKAARDSVGAAAAAAAAADGSGSMLSSVVRRASTMLGGGGGRAHANDEPSRGAHTVLSSQDEMAEVDAVIPLEDIVATPTPSPTTSAADSNPFSDANAEMLTPTMSTKRPALLAASSSIRRPPTPKPLGLPPPRAPPPMVAPPPDPVPEDEEETKETRWWHEWLCGFGEDRRSDRQAGRTNPFE